MPASLFRLGTSFASLLLLLTSCYADNEEHLYGLPAPCDSPTVTYSATISPIIQQNCLNCHSNSANANLGGLLSLEGYTNLRPVAASGRLLKSVRHEPGVSPMPKGGPQLSACDLGALQRWVDAGMPNN